MDDVFKEKKLRKPLCYQVKTLVFVYRLAEVTSGQQCARSGGGCLRTNLPTVVKG